MALLCAAGVGACQCHPVSTGDPDGGAGTSDAAGGGDPEDGGGRDATPGGWDAGFHDAGGMAWDAAGMTDGAGAAADAFVPDAAVVPDADASVPDAALPGDAGAAADAGWNFDAGPLHVHIFITNTCATSMDPVEVTVPANTDGYFAFHNHSADYPADVWMSYGGGFLDLAPHQTWSDPVRHCLGPNVHDEYGDISIAGGGSASCPAVRFWIHCL